MKDKPTKGIFDENSPYSEKECEFIIKKIEELLDNTLSPDDVKFINNKIKECSFCLEQYEIEKNIRKLLKLVKQNKQQDKINKLKNDILAKIKQNSKCWNNKTNE